MPSLFFFPSTLSSSYPIGWHFNAGTQIKHTIAFVCHWHYAHRMLDRDLSLTFLYFFESCSYLLLPPLSYFICWFPPTCSSVMSFSPVAQLFNWRADFCRAMAVERDVFGISGPTYLKSVDWYVVNSFSSSHLRRFYMIFRRIFLGHQRVRFAGNATFKWKGVLMFFGNAIISH